MTMSNPSAASPSTISVSYAGFWLRVVAYFIDFILIVATLAVLGMVVGAIYTANHPGQNASALSLFRSGIFVVYTVEIVVIWLYFAILESSEWRGTVGKKVLSLAVTDMTGRRLTFGRATGRFFAKYVSSLTLCIGYIMVAFTKKKQGLHDMIAGTLVVRKN